MASDPKRIDEVYRDIHRARTDYYSWFFCPNNHREGRVAVGDRPFHDLPEPSKLIVLQETIDWSGITDRDRAHMLLAEIDPGKIADDQRNRLIDMAAAKEPGELVARQDFDRMLNERWQAGRVAAGAKGRDKGIER